MAEKTRADLRKESKPSKKKIALISFLLIVLVGVLSGGYYVYSRVTKFSQPNIDTPKINDLKVDNDYMINFLIMGDDNDEERAATTNLTGNRADSIMLVSMNTKTSKVKMYNFPRDTATVLYGEDDKPSEYLGKNATKINAAYDLGGQKATENTIEHLLPGVKIDYYWTFNFISFKEIVNSIGGIDMNVPVDIYDYKLEKVLVKQGQQHLNGDQALDVARARYQDDDVQRGYRQQLVLEAIATKMQKDISLTQMLKIFDSVSKNVQTSMRVGDMKSLYDVAAKKDWQFEKIEAHWFPFMLDDDSMVMLPQESRKQIIKEINENVEMQVPEFEETSPLNTTLKVLEDNLAGQLAVNPSVQPVVSSPYINELFYPVIVPNVQ